MPYVLGVDVGRTRGAAAVCGHDGPPVVVDADLPPLLALANGEMVVGADAAGVSAEWVAADLLDHVGDDVALLLGGVPYTAHDLLAALVAAIADRVVDTEGGPPDRVAVTHPPDWGSYRRGLLRDALAAAGYPGVLLLPTVVAAAEAEHFRAPLRPGQSLGVALLGGRHAEYALLHRGPVAFDLVGHAAPAAPAVGACLDDLLADLGGQAVKERLSTAAEVRVGESVVTQAAFADLARPVLTRAIDGFRAFLSAERPARAVVAGGTARVPLLADLAATLPTPTTIPDDPATLPARGAALAARPRLALPTPRAAASDPALRPVGIEPGSRAAASDPRLRLTGAGPRSPFGTPDSAVRSVEPGSRAAASDPRLRPAGADPGSRAGASDRASRQAEPGSWAAASDPRLRVAGPDPRFPSGSFDSASRQAEPGSWAAASDPRLRPAGADPGSRAGASDPAFRPVGAEPGCDSAAAGPGFRAAGADPGSRAGGSGSTARPVGPGSREVASDPRLPPGVDPRFPSGSPDPRFGSAWSTSDSGSRPAGGEPGSRAAGRDFRAAGSRSGDEGADKLDTVVSSPGFPPVRLPLDTEPPPRPPVEITPLEPPPRRFARARRGRGAP